MVDVNSAWAYFLNSAQKFHKSQEIYVSPKEEKPYRVIEVTDNSVRVQRVIIGTGYTFSFEFFSGLVERLNAKNGVLPMSSIRESHTVLAKTTFVRLLSPIVDWDDSRQNIIETNVSVSGLKSTENGEVLFDDINKKAWREVKVRSGQNALRDTLLYQYEHQCCVTGCEVKQVLQAAHIEPHAHNGNNSSTNALLLRSDIHDLFDAFLLGFHPDAYTVHISKNLRQTEYGQWEGRALRPRRDGVNLDGDALQLRWNMFMEEQRKLV